MEIKSLQKLKQTNGVYELYDEVIVNDNPFAVFKFPLTARHNMRIDLVCYDIYSNTSSIDVLCAVNGIMNPLTIQDGDVLFYVNEKDLDAVRSDTAVIAAIVDAVKGANKGKQQKTDANKSTDNITRQQTEKAKLFVPPNILQTNNTNIDLGEGTIILKPNF